MARDDHDTQVLQNTLMFAKAFLLASVGVTVLWAAWSYLPRLVEAWWYYALLTLGGAAGVVGISVAALHVSKAVTQLRHGLHTASLELTRKIDALNAESRQRFDRIERQVEAVQRKTPPFLGALTVAAGLWQSVVTKLVPEPKAALEELAISAGLGLLFYWATTALEAELKRDRIVGAIILLLWVGACVGLALLLRSPTEIVFFLRALAPVDYVLVGLTVLVAVVVPILSSTVWRTAAQQSLAADAAR